MYYYHNIEIKIILNLIIFDYLNAYISNKRLRLTYQGIMEQYVNILSTHQIQQLGFYSDQHSHIHDYTNIISRNLKDRGIRFEYEEDLEIDILEDPEEDNDIEQEFVINDNMLIEPDELL